VGVWRVRTRVGVELDDIWMRRNPFPSKSVGETRGERLGGSEREQYLPRYRLFIAASITVSDRPSLRRKVRDAG